MDALTLHRFQFWVHDYLPAFTYPYVLPASMAQPGLTISQVASSPESMTLPLYWWIPGLILVGLYTYFVYSKFLPRFSSHL